MYTDSNIVTFLRIQSRKPSLFFWEQLYREHLNVHFWGSLFTLGLYFLTLCCTGIGWTSWKKRWFILTRTSLVFFRSNPVSSFAYGSYCIFLICLLICFTGNGGNSHNYGSLAPPFQHWCTVFLPCNLHHSIFILSECYSSEGEWSEPDPRWYWPQQFRQVGLLFQVRHC